MSKDEPNTPAPIVVQSPAVASTQASFNEEAARKQRALNMIWQEGPDGTLSYLPTGTETEGIPDFKAVTELSPDNQRLRDTGNQIKQRFGDITQSQLSQVGDMLSQPFSLAQFGPSPAAPNIRGPSAPAPAALHDPSRFSQPMPPTAPPTAPPPQQIHDPDRFSRQVPPTAPPPNQLHDPDRFSRPAPISAPTPVPLHDPATFSRQAPGLGAAPAVNPQVRQRQQDAILSRFQPQMDRDRAQLETSLANQGFMVGSEGYTEAIDESNRARSDFYLGADIQAGDEMGRMFGLQNTARARDISEMTQDYQFATNARDREIAEALLARSQPMSELASFINQSQPRAPTFLPTPQGSIAAPDYLTAAYASANQQNAGNRFNFGQANQNFRNTQQGLFGLAGTAAQFAGSQYGRGFEWD